jgi:hypothetical protein
VGRVTVKYNTSAHNNNNNNNNNNDEPEYLSQNRDGLHAGRPEFDFRQGKVHILCSAVPRPALGRTQSPIHWIPGNLSPGAKRTGRESDHSPTSSAEVKNG